MRLRGDLSGYIDSEEGRRSPSLSSVDRTPNPEKNKRKTEKKEKKSNRIRKNPVNAR
jgi:hypothetical protein